MSRLFQISALFSLLLCLISLLLLACSYWHAADWRWSRQDGQIVTDHWICSVGGRLWIMSPKRWFQPESPLDLPSTFPSPQPQRGATTPDRIVSFGHDSVPPVADFISTPITVTVQHDDVLPAFKLTTREETILTDLMYEITLPDSANDALLSLDVAEFDAMIWRDTKGYASRMKIPYWLVAATTSILPLIFLPRRRKARRRAAHGLCPRCGYDLRATPDRCPECGSLSPAAAPSATTPATH